MNIQILHSHLLELLQTKAKPDKIGEALALCGPAVEYVKPFHKDYLYDIEVTTNRVDTASVMGIAREAAAILPQFGIQAAFKPLLSIKVVPPKKSEPLTIKIDKTLSKRVMAVVMDVTVGESPKWITDRLEAAGIRSLNNLIDITNYVMLEVGHPTHVFDYDRIASHELVFRLSKKGEVVTTLDNKSYELPGNDIVIDDSNGEIIDLPGIMGTKNSVVTSDTKRIIFFIDNNDDKLMRKTSLNLGIRTMAVQLNEKGVDPELATIAMARGIELFTKLAKATVVSKVHDYYHKPYKPHLVKVSHQEIESKIGVKIEKQRIKKILQDLGFKTKLTGSNFEAVVPSWRSEDIAIPEDVIEEIARIYGYHNLPSEIMSGAIPVRHEDASFALENQIKQTLKGFGAHEVYTLSLVPKSFVGEVSLKLKNPLGSDTEYLRTTLIPSLIAAARENKSTDKFHLFEIANVYLPTADDLPIESMRLGGIFKGYSYREAKGELEALLESLHIKANFNMVEKSIEVTIGDEALGDMEAVSKNIFAYEFSLQGLYTHYKKYVAYKPSSKYPAQVEDITFVMPKESKIGKLIQLIESLKNIQKVVLTDTYHDAYTFRIWYHDSKKTLTDAEVEKLRAKVLADANKKFGAKIKD